MALHPWPVDMSVGDVINALREYKTNPKETFHAAWHVVGYAGGKWDPHTAIKLMKAAEVAPSGGLDDLCQAAISAIEDSKKLGSGDPIGVLPEAILAILAQILFKFIFGA